MCGSLLSLTARHVPGGVLQSRHCPPSQGIKMSFNIHLSKAIRKVTLLRKERVRKRRKTQYLLKAITSTLNYPLLTSKFHWAINGKPNSHVVLFLPSFLPSSLPPSLSWAACAVYGSSQARGQIGATAASLHHNNTGSEPCLPPIPQLTVTPALQPTELGQVSNRHPHRY